MYRTIALFALTCLLASATAADDNRLPVPPPAEVEKSTKLIRELFKDEYSKTQPKARQALVERLFKEAEETNDDPTGRYALYREVAELSAATGDVNAALEALGALHLRYRGIKSEQDEPTLKALGAKASAAEATLLVTHLFRAVDDAVAADELDSAERLAELAKTAATRSKILRATTLATARTKDVEGFKKDAPQVKAALKTLETAPTDPAASAVAGKYYCFQREDWEKGLPLLVAGNDAKLKAVAEKDRAGPKEGTEFLALADAWYDLEAAAPAHFKRPILGRAFTFYARAAPDLTGLNRTKAEKRVEELEKVVESRSPFEDFWAAVRTAVRSKDVAELAAGGLVGRKEVRDTAPPGGVLIGFNYAIYKLPPFGQEVIGYLQPIYLTPTGEKLGTGFGRAPLKPQTVKAKPGYAVGAIKAFGNGWEGFVVAFMRIQGKGLNTADVYPAPVMAKSIDGGAVIGDGRPIVGLYGKLFEQRGDELLSFGVLVAGPKPVPKKP